MRPWGWALIGLVLGGMTVLLLLLKPAIDLYLWVARSEREIIEWQKERA